ncbi:MAG: hypothetical protein LBJ91_03930 [Clostridiales Family XIII bacterium]|jgi:dipeptidase D|nr:hypothetical protein [Clostridiales Family XIII bacterium]
MIFAAIDIRDSFQSRRTCKRRDDREKYLCNKRLAVLTAFFLFASCILSTCAGGGAIEEDVSKISSREILEYYQSILSFPRSGPSYPEGVNAYLIGQADILGVDARQDEQGNVVMHTPATAGKEGSRPVVLVAYTGADIVNDRTEAFDPYIDGVWLLPSDENVRAEGTSMGASGALGAATILAILERSEIHGDITAVFAKGDGSAHPENADVSGSSKTDLGNAPIESGLLAPALDITGNPLLIEIGGEGTGRIATGAPMAALLSAGTTTRAVVTGNGRAYVVAATGSPSGDSGGSGEGYVNPVSVVARILSEAKSAGCVYGLSDFTGGTDACSSPSEAQATVILGDYEERQFRRVFDSVAESAMGDAGMSVSMVETARPALAVDEEYVSKALSYIYGLMSIRVSEEDESSASINIGKVALTPSSFSCGISVTAYGSEDAERVVDEQSTIGRLSGIPVEKTGEIPGFGFESADVDAGASGETPKDEAAAFERAYSEASGDNVMSDALTAPSPLGLPEEAATILCIGVSVYKEGTTDEYFVKEEAAIPANAVLAYLESIRL